VGYGARRSVAGFRLSRERLSRPTDLLRRIGFVVKKAKRVPGKADAEAQEAFVVDYEKR